MGFSKESLLILLHCHRCEYEWHPMYKGKKIPLDKPPRCPMCQSMHWSDPYVNKGAHFSIHAKKKAARSRTWKALRSGELLIGPKVCELCGEYADIHHVDYDDPLNVRLLCPSHHQHLHLHERAIARLEN